MHLLTASEIINEEYFLHENFSWIKDVLSPIVSRFYNALSPANKTLLAFLIFFLILYAIKGFREPINSFFNVLCCGIGPISCEEDADLQEIQTKGRASLVVILIFSFPLSLGLGILCNLKIDLANCVLRAFFCFLILTAIIFVLASLPIAFSLLRFLLWDNAVIKFLRKNIAKIVPYIRKIIKRHKRHKQKPTSKSRSKKTVAKERSNNGTSK